MRPPRSWPSPPEGVRLYRGAPSDGRDRVRWFLWLLALAGALFLLTWCSVGCAPPPKPPEHPVQAPPPGYGRRVV